MRFDWYLNASPDFKLKDALAVLPIGSCEQHSDYLPVGTDGLLAERLSACAAELAKSRVWLMPTQQIGYSPHHRAFPGYVTLTQETMFRYLVEVCLCAFENGAEKLLIVNAHGGNQSCLQTVSNELGARYNKKAIIVRYWDLISEDIGKKRNSGPGGMGHAGEFETALIRYLYPELVKESRIRDFPPATGNAYHAPDMFAVNRVYQYKPFHEYSDHGNIGQPQLADAEEGGYFFRRAAEELAKLMDYFMENTF